jgi:hypothetical protein
MSSVTITPNEAKPESIIKREQEEHPAAMFVRSGSCLSMVCSKCGRVLLNNFYDPRTAYCNVGLVGAHVCSGEPS